MACPLVVCADAAKEEEVQRVRLKNIHLSNQLRRIENALRQKEELAEGLHLIDFEQLKIENQSLNEKIEERNEELLKLKKKTTTTVQVGYARQPCEASGKRHVGCVRQRRLQQYGLPATKAPQQNPAHCHNCTPWCGSFGSRACAVKSTCTPTAAAMLRLLPLLLLNSTHLLPPRQILTHVREKLQFIEKENAALGSQLSALEAELADKRDTLGRAKAERDTLRLKGRKIKESGSNITSPALLDDIEVRKHWRGLQGWLLACQASQLRSAAPTVRCSCPCYFTYRPRARQCCTSQCTVASAAPLPSHHNTTHRNTNKPSQAQQIPSTTQSIPSRPCTPRPHPIRPRSRTRTGARGCWRRSTRRGASTQSWPTPSSAPTTGCRR